MYVFVTPITPLKSPPTNRVASAHSSDVDTPKSKTVMAVQPMPMSITGLSPIKSLMRPQKGEDFADDPQRLHSKLAKIYLFSYVWSIGGNVDAECYYAFDEWTREVLLEKLPEVGNLPTKGTVYDWYVITKDKDAAKGKFAPWNDVVQPFNYSKSVPYFQLLVPNVDTTRFSFSLQTCLEVHKSLLAVGGSGVG